MRIFLSHKSTKQAQATVLADLLRADGHDIVDMADWTWGQSFLTNMQSAIDECDHMVALWCPEYFQSEMCMAELEAARLQPKEFLITTKVAACEAPGIYRPFIWGDLMDVIARPEQADPLRQRFGGTIVRPPASVAPPLSNLPTAPAVFAGREDALRSLTTRIAQGNAAITQTGVRGHGGIGKSTLALQFAHSEEAKTRFPIRWWVAAETEEGILAGFAALALRLKLAGETTPPQDAARAVLDGFAAAPHEALIVFDNVEDAALVARYIPDGAHVLMTTRRPKLRLPGVEMISLDFWPEETTAAFLMDQTGDTDQDAALKLAAALGGLPLAAAQAAALCGETGMGIAAYHALFEAQSVDALHHLIEGEEFPHPVAKTFLIAMDRAAAEAPGARDILRIMAALAPEPMPVAVFANEKAPETLRDVAQVELAIAALLKHALVDRARLPYWLRPDDRGADTDCVSAHRLVLRAVGGEALLKAARALGGAFPAKPHLKLEGWPLCDRLATHAVLLSDQISKSKQDLERLFDLSSPLNQAAIYLKNARSDLRKALSLYELALQIDEAAHGPEHPNVALRLSNLANVLRHLGGFAKLNRARAALERALRIDEATHGPEHPRVAVRLSNLAAVLRDLAGEANLRCAREALERALSIDEVVYGPVHPSVAIRLSHFATLLRAHGGEENLTQAQHMLERALRIDEASYGLDHPTVGIRLANLSGVLMSQGDRAEALDAGRRAHGIFLAALGLEHRRTIDVAELVAMLEGGG